MDEGQVEVQSSESITEDDITAAQGSKRWSSTTLQNA
jgi:hypothetical protein